MALFGQTVLLQSGTLSFRLRHFPSIDNPSFQIDVVRNGIYDIARRERGIQVLLRYLSALIPSNIFRFIVQRVRRRILGTSLIMLAHGHLYFTGQPAAFALDKVVKVFFEFPFDSHLIKVPILDRHGCFVSKRGRIQ